MPPHGLSDGNSGRAVSRNESHTATNHVQMSVRPSHLEPPDVALLQRAATGEPEAFGIIYRRYQQVVYRFARAMTGSADAAEDITQEVFVALLVDAAKYSPDRAAFTTYLYGIVRNLTRGRLRRERRVRAIEAVGLMLGRGEQTEDPLQIMEDAELAAQVRSALARLPARYRELIILCDLHGLSYGDTALIVGTSVGAVRSRLHRARQLLRVRLAHVASADRRPTVGSVRCAI
jgi:RNA polymerase sigma-70 factor (ECF subfamily)